MKKDALFICSGIIDSRENDVREALSKQSFEIIEECSQDNWRAFVCRKIWV